MESAIIALRAVVSNRAAHSSNQESSKHRSERVSHFHDEYVAASGTSMRSTRKAYAKKCYTRAPHHDIRDIAWGHAVCKSQPKTWTNELESHKQRYRLSAARGDYSTILHFPLVLGLDFVQLRP
jgi:hypothetical protein